MRTSYLVRAHADLDTCFVHFGELTVVHPVTPVPYNISPSRDSTCQSRDFLNPTPELLMVNELNSS